MTKGHTVHVSEEARKAWEKAQRETKRKPPCPACDKLNETMGAAAAIGAVRGDGKNDKGADDGKQVHGG